MSAGHLAEAGRALTESSLLNEWTEAERLIFATRAQAEATIALAHEQRTANLIALYSMDDGARQGMVDGAGMHSGNWTGVTKQIKERLGF